MKSLRASFWIVLAVFLILLGIIVVSAFSLEKVLPGPKVMTQGAKVMVTIAPTSPRAYSDTSITIMVTDPAGVTQLYIRSPQARVGKLINVNWGGEIPLRPWIDTYSLSELFGDDVALHSLSELEVIITVWNAEGKKTTVIKKISFSRVE